ncbi:DUF5916 domain-containing protein [uncultured Dokdonia sp.]|uniref:DUF5916 domain-containing protein n=1 Tax=uncultured Dokdonia sp. TaxID=575653 RepID=UPI0026173326|nr:DUF5916 domain-containing protein [uncultured Dokdonia sp.]
MQRKLLFLIILQTTYLSFSQDKEVFVKYIDSEIKIDGKLEEAVWEQAAPAKEFWQYFPTDTIQAKNQTEIRFLYDDEKLYVGIKIYTIGKEFIVPSLRRDFRAGGSDNVTLMFDTFNDGTNAFLFGSNPEGVLREALVSGGGTELRGFTTSWDTKWVGETTQYDTYYICEWAIPFSAFKFREGETRWRFNSYQFDTQGNERNTWTNIPQNQFIFNLAYMGDMVFEKPLGNSKSPISIIPYINTLVGKDYETGEDSFDLGVGGDAKLTIGNSLNLDATINPDFSNVEVDQQVTNLTRFEINLPERRQFFIENSDLFADFGDSRDANPFFSRRIGIARNADDETIQNDIIAGARLSGKLSNDLRIGILNIQTATDATNEIGSNNNSVVALQHKLFSRSNISFLFVNRQNTSDESFITSDEEYNRVVGVDYNLANEDNSWNGKVYFHKSFTPELEDDDYSGGARLQYNSRNWRVRGSGVFIGDNFQSDLGFIPRTDILKIDPQVEYLLFPNKGKINRHIFSFTPIITWRPTLDFFNSDYTFQTSWDAEFKNNAQLSANITNNYVFLFDEFDPSRSDGTPLAANTEYRYSNVELRYQSDRRKIFSYTIQPSGGQFFNGNIVSVRGDINYRLQPYFNLAIDARFDHISLPAPFATENLWLLGPRIDVTFNKSVFWATFIQYSSQQDNFSINSRLQWRFAPLSDLFLVYNDNYFTDTVFAPRVRSLNLKVTYWLYL